MDAMIAAVLLVPLMLAALLWFAPSRALALRLAPWAPLPALALALAAPVPQELHLPWLLLDTRLGLDTTGQVFLQFTALIWLAAGWLSRGWLAGDQRQPAFAGFFLLTQAGNLGVCLALDAASFYFFFALMSIAAYGLIVHDRDAAAWRAGRVYLVLALAGEMLILSGLLLAVGAHPLAAACLILGFGVKTGLPLLHVSLPLAYSAAPIPAAAVLAGAMIKAGLLGWLRFLPLGETALPDAGTALMLAGLLGILIGSLVGLTQRQPRALLAYSSISQMGQIALAVGAGLMAPSLWPLLLPAITLFAVHHALAKAALFLGFGVAQRRGASTRVMLGLALPALALAGAPLTSGMLAKSSLKHVLGELPAPWADALPLLLALGALGTALLMLRFLWLLRRPPVQHDANPGLLAPWLLTLLGVAGLAAWLAPAATWRDALTTASLLSATWPILASAALFFVALRLDLRAPAMPPGDLLVPLERLLAGLRHRPGRLPRLATPPAVPHTAMRPAQLDARLRAWAVAGALWLTLLAAVIALLTNR